MNVERAREILDPEHRENYDGMEAVNEACRMGRDALGKLVPLRPYPDGDKKISWPAPAAGAANTCTMRTGMSRTSAGSVGRQSNGDKP